MYMSQDSPFEAWRLANIRQVAVSQEILELLALAFEGGRASKCDWQKLTNEDMEEMLKQINTVFAWRSVFEMVEAKLKEKNNG